MKRETELLRYENVRRQTEICRDGNRQTEGGSDRKPTEAGNDEKQTGIEIDGKQNETRIGEWRTDRDIGLPEENQADRDMK